jgi:hypothetical protein
VAEEPNPAATLLLRETPGWGGFLWGCESLFLQSWYAQSVA